MFRNISLDIDGVIASYPQYFLNYVSKIIGSSFSTTEICKVSLGEDQYKELKHGYRISKEKYQIPIHPRMIELSEQIYSCGIKIYVNSSRPFHLYPDMLGETTRWLRESLFKFELVEPKVAQNLLKHNVSLHVDNEVSEIERLRLEGLVDIKYLLVHSTLTDTNEEEANIIADQIDAYFEEFLEITLKNN